MKFRSISLALLVAASVSVIGISAGIDVAHARSELSIGGPSGKASKSDKATKAGKTKDTKTTKGVKAHPDNQYVPGKQFGYKHGVGVLGRYNPGWRPGQFYK